MSPSMRTRAAVFAGILLMTSAAAAGEANPRHGGRLVDAGAYHVELVAKATAVDVYVSDHDDRPVALAGFKGTAILVVDGKPARIALEPAGTNRLSGASAIALTGKVKGAVRITTPGGTTVSASFN
ncbi:MAG TPA: hypothetical protein VF641_05030 [Methylobacterium sp.]